MLTAWLLATLFITICHGRNYDTHLRKFYDDRSDGLMEDLLRRSSLARQLIGASEVPVGSNSDFIDDESWGKLLEEIRDPRQDSPDVMEQKNVNQRADEFIPQVPLWGPHRINIGEPFDYQVEAKTDTLPYYCDPPNPCPIGVDPDSLPAPCDRGVDFSLEFNKNWISMKMANDQCGCDKEHMRSCPAETGASKYDEEHEDTPAKIVKKAGPYW